VFILIEGVEVYGYVLLWAVWHRERLEEARSLVSGTRSPPTGMTVVYVSFHISHHASPVVPVLEELVRLVSAWVGS